MSKRNLLARLGCVAALVLFAGSGFVQGAEDEGFVSLFDGKTLSGWTQKNGTATYRVEEGTIVGKTSEGSPNSFLCTNRDYSDFELHFDVKVDDELNSGVQFRSASKSDIRGGRVHGPQAEIATNGSAGYVYGESLDTGWLFEPNPKDEKATNAFKKGEWNSYVVIAKGKSIKTTVNGIPVADFMDEKSMMASGFIGLQVHGIAKGTGPFQVRWRNIKIKELK